MIRKISLYVYLIVCVFPIAAGLIYAFSYSIGLIGAMNTGLSFQHWKEVLGSEELWTSFATTIAIASFVVIGSWFIAFIIIRYYNQELMKDLYSHVMLLPLTVPMLIGAFVIMQLFRSGGLFASVLFKFGVISTSQSLEWVNDYWHTGLCICLTLFTVPFFNILVLQQFKKQNIAQLLEVNSALGGSKSVGWNRIVFPILWKESKLSMLLYGIFLFGTYEAALLLGRQNPRLVSVLIAQKLRKFDLLTIPQAYAISIMYTLVIVIFIYLFSKKAHYEAS